MSESLREIIFDANAVQTTYGRRRFLTSMAVACGSIALVPMIGRGAGITNMLQAQTSGETEPNLSDTDILNYALTLEYLEATYYLRADSGSPLPTGATIAGIDPDGNGLPGTVTGLTGTFPSPSTITLSSFFRSVRDHEITHVLALQSALGNAALARSAFKFSFPASVYQSALGFMQTAQALEDTGVTAYLDQVGNLDSTSILGTAGSIAGVEAEHAAAVRMALGLAVTPNDANFDTPATTTQVLAIAGGFITQKPVLPFPK